VNVLGRAVLETTMGDLMRVLWRGDPPTPASAGDALPDLAVRETVPFVVAGTLISR
jgi:hypothetical protein